MTTRRASRKTQAAEEAIQAAEAAGEEVPETTDEEGKELKQRPLNIDLNKRGEVEPAKLKGDRVKVYHKRRTTMFLTDCKLGPEAEGYILKSDLELPNVRDHVIVMGE